MQHCLVLIANLCMVSAAVKQIGKCLGLVTWLCKASIVAMQLYWDRDATLLTYAACLTCMPLLRGFPRRDWAMFDSPTGAPRRRPWSSYNTQVSSLTKCLLQSFEFKRLGNSQYYNNRIVSADAVYCGVQERQKASFTAEGPDNLKSISKPHLRVYVMLIGQDLSGHTAVSHTWSLFSCMYMVQGLVKSSKATAPWKACMSGYDL